MLPPSSWSGPRIQWNRDGFGEAREGAERGILVPVRFERAEMPIDVRTFHTTDLDDWSGDPQGPQVQEVIHALGGLIARKNAARAATETSGVAGSASAPGPARVAICVLPFANMSGDPEQEYFSDGITEDIITDLSKVSALAVISRNSAFVFKGKHVDVLKVARELKVDRVLEGSVRKAGGLSLIHIYTPESARVRSADRFTLIKNTRASRQQGPVNDVRMAHDPTDVGGGPKNIALMHVIDRTHRPGERHCVPAMIAHNTLWFPSRSGGVKNVKGIRCFYGDTRCALCANECLRPIQVPPRKQGRSGLRSLQDKMCIRDSGNTPRVAWQRKDPRSQAKHTNKRNAEFHRRPLSPYDFWLS